MVGSLKFPRVDKIFYSKSLGGGENPHHDSDITSTTPMQNRSLFERFMNKLGFVSQTDCFNQLRSTRNEIVLDEFKTRTALASEISELAEKTRKLPAQAFDIAAKVCACEKWEAEIHYMRNMGAKKVDGTYIKLVPTRDFFLNVHHHGFSARYTTTNNETFKKQICEYFGNKKPYEESPIYLQNISIESYYQIIRLQKSFIYEAEKYIEAEKHMIP